MVNRYIVIDIFSYLERLNKKAILNVYAKARSTQSYNKDNKR